MMILVDTNVWSETTKQRVNPMVERWLHRHAERTILSMLVIAEIQRGISMTDGPRNREMLTGWLERLISGHAGRILEFDLPSARVWGERSAALQLAGKTMPVIDLQLAAQGLAHGLPVATRNTRHYDPTGATLINPWDA